MSHKILTLMIQNEFMDMCMLLIQGLGFRVT